MIQRVARRYRFTGRHHIPSLPAPWNEPHQHEYTVEVVAACRTHFGVRFVLDTDVLDATWRDMAGWAASEVVVDLDLLFGPDDTTVERLAITWLVEFAERLGLGVVQRVTVWEDADRWGQAVSEFEPPAMD